MSSTKTVSCIVVSSVCSLYCHQIHGYDRFTNTFVRVFIYLETSSFQRVNIVAPCFISIHICIVVCIVVETCPVHFQYFPPSRSINGMQLHEANHIFQVLDSLFLISRSNSQCKQMLKVVTQIIRIHPGNQVIIIGIYHICFEHPSHSLYHLFPLFLCIFGHCCYKTCRNTIHTTIMTICQTFEIIEDTLI